MYVLLLFVSSVRVSNELGKARPRAAKYSVYVTIAESLILGLLFMVLIFFVKDHFAVIFTSSVAVQKYVAKLAYLLGITMVLNSVQPVISGELIISLSIHKYVSEEVVLNEPLQSSGPSLFRCGHWSWMAGIGGLHKLRLLLHFWSPSRDCLRLRSKVWSEGMSKKSSQSRSSVRVAS